MTTYDIEATDTFGGEANYSWARRFQVSAKTLRGAIVKAKRVLGYGSHTRNDYGDCTRLDINGACIVVFITESEGQ